MPYVPPEQQNTVWKIWNLRYHCRIPYIHTMSVDYLRHFGMPSVGIPEYDKEIANELIDTMLTIDKMVEYFKKGVTIRVVNKAKTKEIYEIIREHLVLWHDRMRYSLNNSGAPIDDLIDLDNLANALYPHAKKFFTKEITDSLLVRNMQSVLPLSREGLFKAPKTVNPEEATPVEEDRHDSMADTFASFRRNDPTKRKW